MAHEDIVRYITSAGGSTSLDFIKNLPTVLKTIPGQTVSVIPYEGTDWNTVTGDERTWTQNNPNEVLSVLGGNLRETTLTDSEINLFFDEVDFSSFDEFMDGFRNYAIAKGDTSSFTNVLFLYNSIYRDYLNAINVAYNLQSQSFIGTSMGIPDFSGVTDPEWDLIDGLVKDGHLDTEGLFDQMKSAFTHFLKTTPKEERNTEEKFYTAWFSFLRTTAHFSDSKDPTSPSVAVDLPAYEKIYNAFFGVDVNDFKDQLTAFYDKVLEETGDGDAAKGWFIPSHHFANWFDEMRNEYLKTIGASEVDQLSFVSLPEFNEDGTKNFKSGASLLTIDRILRLLVEMIDVLQKISALQAEYLGFLTDWQTAYTDHLNDIPLFTEGDGSPLDPTRAFELGADDSDDEAIARITDNSRWARNGINTEMQALQERIRGKRGLIQDAAKQMQTTINQSHDGANQQVQIATALLQQLGTIISQIFR